MAWIPPITHWGQQGQTSPGVTDFNRIEGNIAILGQYDRAPGYGTATGTNAKSITLSPAPGSYYDGLCFAFKNATQNTGAVTINVNGMGVKAIKKPNGNDVAAGFLKAGSIYTVRYNGTNFILQGSDSAGNATPEHVLAGKTFSNDTDTELTGTMPNMGSNNIQAQFESDVPIPAGYYNGSGKVLRPISSAGNYVVGLSLNRVNTSQSGLLIIKECVINYSGVYRIKFTLDSYEMVYPWDDDDYVWAQVYKNGSPHGTRRTHTSIKTTTYTEDLSFDAGDIFAICIYSTGGGAGIGIQDVFIMSGAKPMVQGGDYDSPDF